MPATLLDILGPEGAIARRLGDRYEHRPQQLEMARAVEGAFAQKHHLLVEAGMTKRSIALSFDSLGLADGVWFVIGPDDRWYPLTGPERHAQLELLGPPSEDVRDLLALI